MAVGSIGQLSYDIVARDRSKEGLESAGERAQRVGKMVGVGMTAVGGGLTLLTDQAKKMQAPIRMTALQLGATTEEIRDLALATTNVTFPLTEVTATFELLTKAGMRNKEEIAATATALDTLGDATGYTASQVTDIMIPAFDAFGIELKDAGQYTDMFTHLSRNTTVELADFSSMVNYLAADLGTMDLSMQDSIAVLEALAEKGIVGSAATREFRTAVSQADGNVTLFYEALGLTEEGVAGYSTKIDEAAGMTEEFASAANTQYGAVDRVKQAISEATLKYGAMLEPLDALGPAMTTLGPIMITLSTITTSTSIPSITALSAALWANPIFLIAGVIAVVIAALYVLEKKFGVVTKAASFLSEGIGTLVSWLKETFMATVEKVRDIIAAVGDKALFILGPIGAVIYIFKNWEEILGIVTGVFDSIIAYITGLYDKFKEMGVNLVKYLITGVKQKISDLKKLISDALSEIRDLFPFSPAKTGPLAVVPDWESYITAPMEKVSISPDMIFEKAFVPGAVSASGGPASNINYHITISGNYIKDDYDVERIADTMMRKLDNLR